MRVFFVYICSMIILDLEGEIWRPVVGYEGMYEISNLGRVKSLDRKIFVKQINREYVVDRKGKLLYPYLNSLGYYVIGLSNPERVNINNKKNTHLKSHGLHIAIAKAFIPNPQNKPCINHINGIKTDNRIDNLEWCTVQENTMHAYLTGLIDIKKIESYQFKKGQLAHNGKIVVNTQNGVFYDSIADAQKHDTPRYSSRHIRDMVSGSCTNKTFLKIA